VVVKKTGALLLVTALSVSLLAACANNDKENNIDSSASETKSGAVESAPAADAGGKVSAEPVTATIFYFSPQFTITGDLPVLKKAAELTNVTLNNVAPIGGEEKQAYNLMLASGELPDLISYGTSELNTVAQEGALQPLDELIDQYAPNIKKFLEERPNVKKAMASTDGKMYVIPYVTDGDAKEAWFIRQDWLDKLSLPQPKTVDEYYNTLVAFRDQDPNGNGKKDEVPFFSRVSNNGVYALLPLWDSFYDFYIGDDNKVHYGPYEENYKAGMSNIAKWYKEGLIDKEIFTRGNNARDVMFNGNLGGSIHDWFASSSNFNVSAQGSVPGFSLLPFAPPASASGKVQEVTKRDTFNGRGWSISSSAKNPETLMKYIDFWWSEEGRRMFNFGIEGETYTMVDGKPIFTEEVLKQPSVVDYLASQYGSQLLWGAHQDYEYEVQWSNKVAVEGIKMYTDNGYINKNFQVPPLNFSMEAQNRLKEILPPIQTYVSENGQKWVMGGEDVDANFDKFNKRLKDLGIEEVLNLYQQAYEQYQQ